MQISKRYIEVEIDGKPVKFYKLTPYDRAEIATEMYKVRRAAFEANLAHFEDKNQKSIELEQFDKTFYQQPIMRLHILSDAGQLDVFRRALKTNAGEILKDFTPDEDESFELAAQLCGVKLSPKVETKEPEDTTAYGEPSPNPQTPAEDSYSPAK
jgi:hypothetical protein